MNQQVIDYVKGLSDAEKVKLLKRCNYMGLKYDPATGSIRVDNVERLAERIAGICPDPKPD